MPEKYYPQTPLEERALRVATMAHNNQVRKGAKNSVPYIRHPEHVALLLQQAGESSTRIAAGLLHDVLEDAPSRYPQHKMRAEFGHDVTNMVIAVTKNSAITDWRKRNEAQIASLAVTPHIGALPIWAADKSSSLDDTFRNYEELGEDFWGRFNSDKHDQLWKYQANLKMLDDRIPNHPLVHRLGAQVIQLESLVAQAA
jgi:(p)ppGpp synthase/HD superfamily hydrolase